MDPGFVGILGIIGLFFLLATGMSIGLSMLLIGFVGYCLVMGVPAGLGVLSLVLRNQRRYL